MIHYHGLPMAPNADMIRAYRSHHAMVSFANPQQLELVAEVCQSITLDNGAFSAWMHQRAYDFAGFTQWAAEWIKHPAVDWVVIPDVIDGDEQQNDALLATWPLDKAVSVPVWHMHESIWRLFRLCTEYPRVALGSSGEFRTPGSKIWWARMAEAMNHITDSSGRPICKLHGLRMLDPVLFSHLPLSSADSTNVARNVGIDKAWTGPYVPKSKWARALVMMDRIESHASSAVWSRGSSGVEHNLRLLG
jgi:hypothetical protein